MFFRKIKLDLNENEFHILSELAKNPLEIVEYEHLLNKKTTKIIENLNKKLYQASEKYISELQDNFEQLINKAPQKNNIDTIKELKSKLMGIIEEYKKKDQDLIKIENDSAWLNLENEEIIYVISSYVSDNGTLLIDKKEGLIAYNGKLSSLSPTELELLLLLIEKKGNVVTYKEIDSANSLNNVVDNTPSKNISRLNAKLKNLVNKKIIENAKKQGYYFAFDVKNVEIF